MISLRDYRERWRRTFRHRAKTFIGARPALFFPIFRRRSTFDSLLVHPGTDICIEGFPRSANSFAAGAFEQAQQQPVQIAHHTHVPANAMRACEWGIPTLVLIRAPHAAIVSVIALSKETQLVNRTVESPIQYISFHDWVHAWLTFYQSLLPYRERIVIAPFEEVIQGMGAIIQRVNIRFGTDFDIFHHTEEAVRDVHAKRGYHAGPSQRRKSLKQGVQADLDEALRRDESLQAKIEEADSLHSTFLSSCSAEMREYDRP